MPPPEPAPPPSESPHPVLSTLADDSRDPSGPLPPADAFLGSSRPMTKRQTRWFVIKVVARSLGVATLVLIGYFLLPDNADGKATGLVVLLVGLAVLVVVIVSELRRIVVSEHPAIRGVEAVAIIVPLFVVVFAYAYVWMSNDDPANFTQSINRVDGIYFTITMLSTVGFGDITAVSQSARIVVTVQMLLNLVLIGVVAKLIVGASRIGVQRRRSAATGTGATTGPDPAGSGDAAGPNPPDPG